MGSVVYGGGWNVVSGGLDLVSTHGTRCEMSGVRCQVIASAKAKEPMFIL